MMKKLRYFCTLLLMAVAGVAWAQTQETHTIGWGTASGDAGTFTNFDVTSGEVAGVLSFTSDKNSSSTAPAYNANSSELRLYYNSSGDGGSITITPKEGITITGAVITTSTLPAVAYYVDGGSATSVSGSSNTYTISNISASSSLKIQNVNTSNTQLRIKTIAITYTVSSTVKPAISADNVNITSDATEGVIAYTINNPATGGSLTADTDSEWLLLDDNFESPIAFLCDANNGAERTATVTLTYSYGENESVTKDVIVTQAAYVPTVPGYVIDFENEASQYTDWTFTNMESKQTGNANVTAHGGTYYGTTGGKASASIATKTKIATPYTLTCYVTKQSNNTTASNWKIEVSSDGEVWTTVKEQSATSMTAGTWVELTASLTSYTDVYVRVSYSGSTAVRNIDDLTLVTEIPTSPIINAENPAELAYDATQGEIAYTITNPVEGTLLQATADADWVSDIIVGDEAITFTTTANELKTERVATFTLTYEGAEDKTVTVTQAGNPNIIDKIENISEVGVPYNVQGTVVAKNSRGFVIGDGTGFVYTYLNDTPNVAVGDMVKISGTTGTYGNIIQFTSSATIEPATESDYTPMTPAVLVDLDFATGGPYKSDYFQFEGTLAKDGNNYVVTVSSGDLRFSYPTQTAELDALDGKKVAVKAYFSGISGMGGQNEIVTFMLESIEEVATTVTITIKNGFTATTFSCDKALDFSNVEGITANIITDENGTTKEVKMVPANTGLYIVRGDTEGEVSYEVPVLADETEADDDVSANWLIPTDGTEFKSDESTTYYVFGKQNGKEAFYKVPASGYTPSANKAVLVVNAPASSAKEMIVIGGDVTGIESIENGTIVNDNYYTIDGKLVKGQPTQKGIYVVNGRKVVIK